VAQREDFQQFDLVTIGNRISSMINDFIQLLPLIVIGLIVFILFFIIGIFVKQIIQKATKKRKKANLGIVLGRLAQWAMMLFGLFVALAIIMPGVTPAKILGVMGLGSIAIGFALKDILQNFMAGILILLREPFKLGDEIKYKEFSGKIIEVETRSTFIKTYDGKKVIIPNGEIYTNAITVETAYKNRRLEYDVGIGYEDDINRAIKEILMAIKELKDVVKKPAPDILVSELGDNAVILKVRWWTPAHRSDVIASKSNVVKQIKYTLDKAGIDIPYPTRVVLLHNEKNEE